MKNSLKWDEKLKGCGFKLTAPREAIVKVLAETDQHLSAEDIYKALNGRYPAIGLTTVYRTLDLFQQTGIVSKFEFGQGRARYELSDEYGKKEHHHHLICKKCMQIIDYSDFFYDECNFISKAEKGLKSKFGYEIESHLIRFYGICPSCKG